MDIVKKELGVDALLSRLGKKKEGEKRKTRLLVLGLDNSGKTTILKSFNKEELQEVTPTQGFNIKQLSHMNLDFKVWDIGGQKAIRKHWSNYYDDCEALMYVIDSTDTARMPEC